MTKPIATSNGVQRRSFDASFKRQVVKVIREQHLSVSQVCRDMNLVDSAVRRCITQFSTLMRSANLASASP